MNRRKFLASAGVISSATLSGCLDAIQDRNGDENGDDNGTAVFPDDHVDRPPHSPSEPPEDEWNPDYLGDGIDDESELNFSSLGEVTLQEPKLHLNTMGEPNEYAVRVITDEDTKNELLDANDPPVNFDEHMIVVIESGYGSSSIYHSWERVDKTEDGIWLHGFYTRPEDNRGDFSERSSILRVDLPDDISDPIAQVSLTVSTRHRVNFESTEGVVGIESLP